MLDVSDLEINVLEFHQKNFGFDQLVELGETEYAIFRRTETESESKFRPRLVHLQVIVPRAWVIFDLAADLLLIGEDGITPGPRSSDAAVEAAAEKPEFKEQGVTWHRAALREGGFAYLPASHLDRLTTPAARAQLGL